MNPLTLDLRPVIRLTHEQFEQIALANPDLRIELSADGELSIMPPTGGNTGRRNADLTTDLNLWNRQTRLGVVFDSSTIFRLPNGAERSPDAAWIILERWNALTQKEQDSFPPLCPDFVIELRSKTDSLKPLQAKMQEYQDNGCRLGLHHMHRSAGREKESGTESEESGFHKGKSCGSRVQLSCPRGRE